MLLAGRGAQAAPADPPTVDPFQGLATTLAELAGEPKAPLKRDPALDRAALRHAQALLADPGAATLESVQKFIQDEGLADAQVLPFSIRAEPEVAREAALAFARTEAQPRGLTHVGVGLAPDGAQVWLVALFSRRPLVLQPLPRTARRGTLTVRGGARHPVEALMVGPCPPQGACRKGVTRLSVRRKGKAFAVDLPLTEAGRYVLELVVSGPRGPEVGALWSTAVGVSPGPIGVDSAPTPNTSGGLRGRIDHARSLADVSPLSASPPLDQAAQAHAEAVCAARQAVHVLGGRGPTERARAAGYPGTVSENVAIAGTVEQAHENFLRSPSHRVNVLDPLAAELGVGVAARAPSPGLSPAVCVVELYGR